MKRLIITAIWPIIFLSSHAQNPGNRAVQQNIFEEHVIQNTHKEEVFCTPTKDVIFYEGFEAQTEQGALPEGWEIKRTLSLDTPPQNNATWPFWFRNSASFNGFTNPSKYIKDGIGSMGIAWNSNNFTWAISPELYIPALEGDVILNYWVWFYNGLYGGTMYYSSYHIKVYTEGVWHLLASFTGNDTNTNTFQEKVSLAMNAFKGKTVKIAFIHEYTNGWEMAIDEVSVEANLQTDFAIKKLSVSPIFGLLPGDEVTIDFKVYANSENAGSVTASLFINGIEKQRKTSVEFNNFGQSQQMRFNWTPENYGPCQIEVRIPFDGNNNNNSLTYSGYINHYVKLAEDFENFELDGLGFPQLSFPPSGWSITSAAWIGPTTDYQVSGIAAASMIGRTTVPEQAMYTNLINFTSDDKWIRFYIRGANNHIYINPAQYPGANPPYTQGFSKITIRYAPSLQGPWTDLGDPVEFKNIYDEQGALIQSANGVRMVDIDISGLEGTYYLGFFHSSTFALTIGSNTFYSYAFVDNIMIGNSPNEARFTVTQTNGTKVKDAMVQIFNSQNSIIRETTTSSQGIASFPLLEGDYTYKVMKLGHQSSQGNFTINEPLLNLNVTLPVSTNLHTATFNILLPGNIPAENALVTISSFNGLSNHEGIVEVGNLAPGTYSYRIYLSGYHTYNGAISIQNQNISENIILSDLATLAQQQDNLNSLVLYPNPSNGILRVYSEHYVYEIEVFDLSGKLVFRKDSPLKHEDINLQILNPGLYIVKITTTQGIAARKIQILK